MLPQKRYLSLAIFLIALSLTALVPASEAESPPLCKQILDTPGAGSEVLNALGNRINEAAAINEIAPAQLTQLILTTPTFNLDICGRAFYAESMMGDSQALPLPAELASELNALPPSGSIFKNGVVDSAQVFKLHSNPGSSKTLYLDFDGEKIEATAWNNNFNDGKTWQAVGFSQDTNYQEFSKSELEVIQSVWQRVAEDYSPWDIDVTTELPLPGVLERSDENDKTFGTRALISGDSIIFNKCKCSGLAYVGVFDSIGVVHDLNQPAWVFTQGVGSNPKYIAEAVSHEVGHTLGLSHDGSKSAAYYSGLAGWAPIMGVGFYKPLTQWSNGSYPDSSNNEDDFVVVASHGLALRPDEDKNDESSAREIKNGQGLGGVITSEKDVDYFKFKPVSKGTFTIKVSVATYSPNLDLMLSSYTLGKKGDTTSSNPPLVEIDNDKAGGLGTSITKTFDSNTTYIFTVEGANPVNDKSGNINKYGSVGTYKFEVIEGKSGVTSPSAPKPTSPPTSSTSSDNTLPNKLVLPVSSTDSNVGGAAPMELPVDVKISTPHAINDKGRFRYSKFGSQAI